MSITEFDHLWVAYWTAQATRHRRNHDTEWLLLAERRRELALLCEEHGT